MLPLPALLLITHLVEILMLLSALANQLAELLEPTTRTRPVLAVRNRSWCGVSDEADEVARPIAVDGAAVAGHEFHPDVAEEGDQICHAPRTSPVDVIRGELLRRVGRGVKKPQRGSDERGHLAMRKPQEEALVLRPRAPRVLPFLDIAEELGLGLQPGEAEVGGERVHGADHVGVLEVPGVLVRHPLCVGEDAADGGALARDGALVAAQLLQADDVEGRQLEGHVGLQPLGDALAVQRDELVLLFRAGGLGEVVAGLVGDEGFHGAVYVLGDADDLDGVVVREGGDEVLRRVEGARLLVGEDALRVGDEVRVAAEQVLSNVVRVDCARGRQLLQPVLEHGRLPLRHEGQRPGPFPVAVLLEFEEEGLDELVIFVVVGINGAVTHNVGRGGDIAARGRRVFKTKADSIKVRRDTWQVQERVKLVALRMPLRLDRCLLLGAEEGNRQCRSGQHKNLGQHAEDARNEI